MRSCRVQSEGVKNGSKGLQETGLPVSDSPNKDRQSEFQKGSSLTHCSRGPLCYQVDDYPVAEKSWDYLPDSADTRLDNPRYIYFGRNGELVQV